MKVVWRTIVLDVTDMALLLHQSPQCLISVDNMFVMKCQAIQVKRNLGEPRVGNNLIFNSLHSKNISCH